MQRTIDTSIEALALIIDAVKAARPEVYFSVDQACSASCYVDAYRNDDTAPEDLILSFRVSDHPGHHTRKEFDIRLDDDSIPVEDQVQRNIKAILEHV